MSERTGSRVTAEEGADGLEEGGVVAAEESTQEGTEAAVRDRVRARLRSPFTGLFSLRLFVILLAVTASAMVLVGTVLPIPLGGSAGLLGIASVGFAVGIADAHRRYLELLVAGAVASGLGTLFDHLLLTAFGMGVPLVALGVGAGGLAAVVGHYFGRDLRAGLTRSI